MGEKGIENQILHWLNTRPWCFAWKNNSTGVFDPASGVFRKSNNRFALNGVPDVLAIIMGGHFLGIEVKSEKGVVSGAQKAFLFKAEKMKALVFVARSLLDVQETLKGKNPQWI